jgi:hypothetical protein
MQEMNKADAIFLGACSIMSSSINNFFEQSHASSDASMENAIAWSEKIYNETHPATAALPEPKAASYIIEFHWKSDKTSEWSRSNRSGLNVLFASYAAAQRALDEAKKLEEIEYRITEVEIGTA